MLILRLRIADTKGNRTVVIGVTFHSLGLSVSEPQSQPAEDVATLSVSEPLYDQVACDRMSASVRDSIAKGKRTIVIDLAGCAVLSAYGVGQLISVSELAKSASSSLSIKGIRPEILELLKQLMVDQIIPIQSQ